MVPASLLVAACAAAPAAPTTAPATPEEMREQIHAATGHEPEACDSMMGDTASIRIQDEVAMPSCIIVQEDARLVVSNESSVDQRFAVSDPAGVNVRHDIYVLELPSGTEDVIPEIGERTSSGVYPFYIRGGEPFSGFLVVVP